MAPATRRTVRLSSCDDLGPGHLRMAATEPGGEKPADMAEITQARGQSDRRQRFPTGLGPMFRRARLQPGKDLAEFEQEPSISAHPTALPEDTGEAIEARRPRCRSSA